MSASERLSQEHFSGVQTWIFDLDNTLYPAECRLFEQIDKRMSGFIQNLLGVSAVEARRYQKDLYAAYGTTLSGLMNEHNVAPHTFMDYVHDIDVSVLAPCEQLIEAISSLPGKRFIFTNGSQKHAQNVAGALGLFDFFDGVFDIEAACFVPKPHAGPYDRFIEQFEVEPETSVMFEDIAVNLEVPHARGMTTVLVCSDADWIEDEPMAKRPARLDDRHEHVHYQTSNLAEFLGSIATLQKSVSVL